MIEITVKLNDFEYKVFERIANSPQDWIQNATNVRIQTEIEKIVQITVTKCLEHNLSIPSSKEEIIELALTKNWI